MYPAFGMPLEPAVRGVSLVVATNQAGGAACRGWRLERREEPPLELVCARTPWDLLPELPVAGLSCSTTGESGLESALAPAANTSGESAATSSARWRVGVTLAAF